MEFRNNKQNIFITPLEFEGENITLDLGKFHTEFRLNNNVYVSRNGDVIKLNSENVRIDGIENDTCSSSGFINKIDKDKPLIIKVTPFLNNGYWMISKDDLGTETDLYLHRMVVYSWGDCNDRPFTSTGMRNVVDHLDMNHDNNCKENLQLVSEGINLFRAYYKTAVTQSRRDVCNPSLDQATFEELLKEMQEGNFDRRNGLNGNNAEGRFKRYYDSLDFVDKMILENEIKLDLEGKY